MSETETRPVCVAFDGRSLLPLRYALAHTTSHRPLRLLLAHRGAGDQFANPFVVGADERANSTEHTSADALGALVAKATSACRRSGRVCAVDLCVWAFSLFLFVFLLLRVCCL